MEISMIGPGIALGMGCIGSSIGCSIAGMASHGVMTRIEEGHAKLIAMSAIPASQSIYGFLLMMFMSQSIKAGTLLPLDAIGIAFFVGLAIMASSIFQGKCAATGIQASAKNPALYGKTMAAIVVVESFALFAFVFAMLIIK